MRVMQMKNYILLGIALCVCLLLAACQASKPQQPETATDSAILRDIAATVEQPESVTLSSEIDRSLPAAAEQSTEKDEEVVTDNSREKEMSLQMYVDDAPVSVIWEDNDSVKALKELCRNASLTISMSMYGGFEQVGSIGAYLPQNDVQTTTSVGDIVLYSGNQMVVFYGSNTWAYTRLGHITDKTNDELTQLLSNGNVTITLTY